ncbi:NADP oxidoreductase coenzyme [Sphingomonas sp. Leaf357]|uniref:NADPH-dependent F420 reductase n=1 Tax=Sphingomonas sp. Leaf357 TaxID=1736350 RepID=UPI0006FADBA3|nr:NADPH-dependent F420 reductase [Sphingomonas sp. Leaf357]KQS03583.1 NADP oxidoreductase coenzyme [Sphingomonas sp. Leaf357]
MTYAIIGTGNVGTAVARRFAHANIPVRIANTRGPDSIAPLARELGEAIQPSTIEEALEADVIFLALYFIHVEALAAVRSDWSGKTVIDATNPYGVSAEQMAGRLSSDIVAATLPGATVVKAFNQLPASVLARDPQQENGRRVIFVSGNDAAANSTVKSLAAQLGFATIDVGRIDEGGRLLAMGAPLVLHNLVEYPFK